MKVKPVPAARRKNGDPKDSIVDTEGTRRSTKRRSS